MAIKKSDIKQAKLMLRISDKYTKKYTRILKNRRQATIDKTVKEFERTGNEKVIDDIKEPYLKPLLKQLYLSVAAEIGTLQLASFGQKASIEKHWQLIISPAGAPNLASLGYSIFDPSGKTNIPSFLAIVPCIALCECLVLIIAATHVF